MTEEEALIRAIVSNPEELTPRGVYKDWLLEYRPEDPRLAFWDWRHVESWQCHATRRSPMGREVVVHHLPSVSQPILAPWLRHQVDDWLCSDNRWPQGLYCIRGAFVEEWYPHAGDNHENAIRWIFSNHPIRRCSVVVSPYSWQINQSGWIRIDREPAMAAVAEPLNVPLHSLVHVRRAPQTVHGFSMNLVRKTLFNELCELAEKTKGQIEQTRGGKPWRVAWRKRTQANDLLALACLRIGRRLADLPVPEPVTTQQEPSETERT